MKLIESSAEYIPQEEGLQGIYKQIERAGRICYKSEDKITDDSAKEFVDRMISSGHLAMLEHGTMYMQVPLTKDTYYIYHTFAFDKYSKVNGIYPDKQSTFYITTNFRVFTERGFIKPLDYLCSPTDLHEKRYTFKLITSIGIVRELLRHRVFSFANESTRYCNYSKDKFDNEITFIIPSWSTLSHGTVQLLPKNYKDAVFCIRQEHLDGPVVIPDKNGNLEFLEVCAASEREYKTMIKEDFTAQQAREVLPLCTKSELIMTGFESDWQHFFSLRLFGQTGKPHPDMVILCEKIKDECIKNNIMTSIFRKE